MAVVVGAHACAVTGLVVEGYGLIPCNYLNPKGITMSQHFKKQHTPNRNRAADRRLDGLSWKHMRFEQHEPLVIANRGGDIRETNYFDTERAWHGFFFVSWNASVARILVPDTQRSVLLQMATGKECVITRGTLAGADALELMFDDHSDVPFALCLGGWATDRWFASADQPFTVAAWTRDGKAGEWVGRYRTVEHLPCLQPWGL